MSHQPDEINAHILSLTTIYISSSCEIKRTYQSHSVRAYDSIGLNKTHRMRKKKREFDDYFSFLDEMIIQFTTTNIFVLFLSFSIYCLLTKLFIKRTQILV